jgi:hypothetical protein
MYKDNKNILQIVYRERLRANFVNNYEFGGSFGMILWWDLHEVEVTPILKLLVTFGASLEGVFHVIYTLFPYKLTPD